MALQVASGMLIDEKHLFTGDLAPKGLTEFISTNIKQQYPVGGSINADVLEEAAKKMQVTYVAIGGGNPFTQPASEPLQSWGIDRPPAEALLGTIGVMQLAGVRLKKHGWSRGSAQGVDGSLCLGAALGVWSDDSARLPYHTYAAERVAKALPITGAGNPAGYNIPSIISFYNDKIAKDVRDIFRVLEDTIQIALAELAESV